MLFAKTRQHEARPELRQHRANQVGPDFAALRPKSRLARSAKPKTGPAARGRQQRALSTEGGGLLWTAFLAETSSQVTTPCGSQSQTYSCMVGMVQQRVLGLHSSRKLVEIETLIAAAREPKKGAQWSVALPRVVEVP